MQPYETMNKLRSLLFICCLLVLSLICTSLHPDAGLSINDFVIKYGYPFESHDIQTEDGYILSLHRIPYGLNYRNYPNNRRPPILLMHSFLTTSSSFINMGPNKSIGFLLAEAGFDVWLGNQRGNTFGRRHITLDPDLEPEKFFNFSMHEIGIYDIPAKIDYILKTTKQQQLYYIGHSQGCGAFFIMATERPEYNHKIKLMISLAPAAFLGHITSPVARFIINYLEVIQVYTHSAHIYEFLRFNTFAEYLGQTFCSEGSIFQELCALVFFLIAGFDSPQLDRNFIPVVTSCAPSGASMQQFFHIIQFAKTGNFSQYDYGIEKNLEVYGQQSPKLYNLSRVTVPVILHAALNDWLVSPIDVEILAKQLPNVIDFKIVPYESFNHLDFIWAIDVKELVNDEVINELRAWENS